MDMKKNLKLLLLEDSEDDAALLLRALGRSFAVDALRVESSGEFNEALGARQWDIVITDYSLPSLSGMDVVKGVRGSGQDIPVIVVSGVAGEETAVSAMRAGASDYILKENVSRLVPVVERELREAAGRRLHKLAQERLRQSERKFGNLMEAIPFGIAVLNMNREVVEMNSAMVDIFGYGSKEELRNMRREDLYLDPEDRIKLYQRLSTRGSAKLEVRMRRKDGTLFWASLNSTIKTPEDADTYIIIIIQDITGRKNSEIALLESEERFRQIFEQNADAQLIMDCSVRKVIDANPATVRLYGYTRQELVAGGTPLFIARRGAEPIEELFCGTEDPKGLSVERMASIRKDGGRIIVSIRGQRIRLVGSDVIYCTIRDITDRVRLQEESNVMQSKLIHANKMASIGILSSGVAHEINNPNNFILSNSSMLAAVWADAARILEEYYHENGEFSLGGLPYTEARKAAPELIAGISDGARRVKDIVNGMKTIVRPDKDDMSGTVDVNQAVRAAESLLKHQIEQYTHDWRVTLAEDLPKVRGSVQKIEQVMINLIMNALQALTGNRCGVEVATSYERRSGCVLIKVSDEGIGMSSDVTARLTEPFFTTRADDGGTGLGLAISYSIVAEHGGTIEFESGLGKGTAVYIRLPAIL
ncbi:MAG: PAS domain S-box protein [Deltaproteobacteria bacterium]|nr:PAS domain S-box protein [Deltaproteobacteria bacterium]